MIKRTSTN